MVRQIEKPNNNNTEEEVIKSCLLAVRNKFAELYEICKDYCILLPENSKGKTLIAQLNNSLTNSFDIIEQINNYIFHNK